MKHVVITCLQVEEGTPFARWYQPGKKPLPDDDAAWQMYAAASTTLRAAGYEHYEVRHGGGTIDMGPLLRQP
jgi:coproporphyrinogen III oxidase-like Fe-S oxidoreductase